MAPQPVLRPAPENIATRSRAGVQQALMGAGASPYTAGRWAGKVVKPLEWLTPVGDAAEFQDNLREAREADDWRGRIRPALGNAGIVALAALGGIPGKGVKAAKPALKMDRASRMERAKEQGYLEQPFWHGRTDPNPTEPMPRETFYSTNQDYAVGRAKTLGGKAHEYRLRPNKTLDMSAPASTHTLADFVDGLLKSGDERGARNLISAFVDFGGAPEQFVRAARSGPAQGLGMNGGAIQHVLDTATSRSWGGALRSAGYDSLKTGDDMIMLNKEGQRRVTAKFNPRKIGSSNLLAGTAGAAAALPMASYVSQDRE